MKALKSPLWHSIEELAQVVMSKYSVTAPTKEQYLAQVSQYPLYLEWYERILKIIWGSVLELGPGPGILAERCYQSATVQSYVGIEPHEVFAQMTREAIGAKGTVTQNVSEEYTKSGAFDFVVGTAWYHHSWDKPKSLENCFINLKSGGKIIIADGFLPEYPWGDDYQPTDKSSFVRSVFQYMAAQVLSMPSPDEAQVIDQVMTWFLDTVRIEELKVCISILIDQLKKAGFVDIDVERMVGNNPKVNYGHLGYCFITARKP